jgi:predicted DNA-binding transcriptional regulator AlpA
MTTDETAGNTAAYAALQDKLADPSPSPLLEERHLSMDEVCVHVGGEKKPLHPTTVRAWIKSRGFPQAIHLSSNTARWRRSEIDAWIEQQRGRA